MSNYLTKASSDSWKKAEQLKTRINKMSIVEVANKQAGMFQEFLQSLK